MNCNVVHSLKALRINDVVRFDDGPAQGVQGPVPLFALNALDCCGELTKKTGGW
jgi:hypothetical protein